jgi:hypothetical protein
LDNKQGGEICQGLGGGKFAYLRNDQITVDGNEKWNAFGRPANRDWTQVLRHFEYVVLNKGAHYIPSEEEFIEATNKTAIFLRDNFINKDKDVDASSKETSNQRRVFYRTTAAGHWYAQAKSTPNTELLTKEPVFQCPPDPNSKEYQLYCTKFNWDKFDGRNKLALSIFQSALGDQLTGMCRDNSHSFLRINIDIFFSSFS